MKETIIHVKNDGPYELVGSFSLVDEAGDSFDIPKSISLCRCGYSHEKPFCDGSHENNEFKSNVEVNELMVEV